MGIESVALDVMQLAIKVCKEYEYLELHETIHSSYMELVKVEAQSRREKASTLIRSIQKIDHAMITLNYEYSRVKERNKLTEIRAIEAYLYQMSCFRQQLVKQKNSK